MRIPKRRSPARSPRWTAVEAQSVVREVARSGVSVARFASERGVRVGRLYRWKRRLSGGDSARPEVPPFTELTVRPAATAAIELLLPGGIAVRLGGASRLDDALAILGRLAER